MWARTDPAPAELNLLWPGAPFPFSKECASPSFLSSIQGLQIGLKRTRFFAGLLSKYTKVFMEVCFSPRKFTRSFLQRYWRLRWFRIAPLTGSMLMLALVNAMA